MNKLSRTLFVAALWVSVAAWAGVRFEPVYLEWLGASPAADPDHLLRLFAIGLLCVPGLFLSLRVPAA